MLSTIKKQRLLLQVLYYKPRTIYTLLLPYPSTKDFPEIDVVSFTAYSKLPS